MSDAPPADASATDALPTLLIVIASTRPGRVGAPVGRWFRARAEAHGGFRVRTADLAELALPMMDEPNHPRLRKYTHEHTKAWSAQVDAADAFAFVFPEYNHGFAAPLKNALDYLFAEWAHKPVGFVSYGGVSAGLRAASMLKPVVTALSMTPVVKAVSIPRVGSFVSDDGTFEPNEALNDAAEAMLNDLTRHERVLRQLRD